MNWLPRTTLPSIFPCLGLASSASTIPCSIFFLYDPSITQLGTVCVCVSGWWCVCVRYVVTRSKNMCCCEMLKEPIPLPSKLETARGYRVMICYCWLCVLFWVSGTRKTISPGDSQQRLINTNGPFSFLLPYLLYCSTQRRWPLFRSFLFLD